jgi:hypothetical protein
MNSVSFGGIAIVSCGTLSLELNFFKAQGLVDDAGLDQISSSCFQGMG